MIFTDVTEHRETGDLVLMQYLTPPVGLEDRRTIRNILTETPGGMPSVEQLDVICGAIRAPTRQAQFVCVNDPDLLPAGLVIWRVPYPDLLQIEAFVLRQGYRHLTATVLEALCLKRPYVTFTCPEREVALQLALKSLGFKAIKVYPQFFGEEEGDGFLFLRKPREDVTYERQAS